MTMSYDLTAAETERRDAFVERITAASIGTFDLLNVYLGERLGLFQALVDGGPATSAELAARTGLHERYVREWLEHGAVTAILDVTTASPDAGERQFGLSAAHAAALLDQDSLSYATPQAVTIMGGLSALPKLVEVFRSGAGFPFEAAGGDMGDGQASANRPMFRSLLSQVWLPAVPGLDARLQADPPARIVDIGMGHGWSSIAMAQAYPKVTVDGLDLDGPSVARATRNAAEAGLSDRVRFAARSAADPALVGHYDLVTAFECIHDMSYPVAVLEAMRGLLADGGSVLIADEKADEAFSAPGDELQRYLYGWSVAHCLATSMDGPEPAGTGTVMRPATLRAYAEQAGFSRVDILPIEHDAWRFYWLRP